MGTGKARSNGTSPGIHPQESSTGSVPSVHGDIVAMATAETRKLSDLFKVIPDVHLAAVSSSYPSVTIPSERSAEEGL